jgi:kynurenine formamidase
MQLIDFTVPLDWNLSVSPDHTPFSLKPIERIAKGNSSNVSTLPPSPRGLTTLIEGRMPLRIAGTDGAPPRVVLRKS